MSFRSTLLIAGCLVLSTLGFPSGPLTPAPAMAQTPSSEGLQTLMAQIDELWDKKRQETGAINQMRALLDQAHKSYDDRYEVSWRMARHQWWLADAETDNSRMEALARKGWEWGEKAIKANPAGVEGQFWTSVNIGQYSLAIGILRALANGIESKFNAPLDRSLKLNKTYAGCGPLRTKGNYHSSLPWPKRDLDKAQALLEESIKLCPDGIRSRLYLAEVFQRRDDTNAAIAECDRIINMPIEKADPGDYRRIVDRARALKKQLSD